MRSWTKSRWIVLIVMVVALHLIFLVGLSNMLAWRTTSPYNQNGFNDGYDQIAKNLVEGNGYRFYPQTAPTLMREPGYPILLAGITAAFGSSFIVIKLTNLLMALTTAWLVVCLGRKFLDSPVVYAAPLLFLLHPGVLLAESRGAVEMLYTLLTTLFLLSLYRSLEKSRWWNFVLSGIVLGLAVSVRSVPMLFPFFWGAYLLIFERRRIPIA